MEDLQIIIDNLIAEHGIEAVQAATINNQAKADGTPPTCPTGYYWDGQQCVKDVG